MTVRYPPRPNCGEESHLVDYEEDQLDQLQPAWAITVHKAQGAWVGETLP